MTFKKRGRNGGALDHARPMTRRISRSGWC